MQAFRYSRQRQPQGPVGIDWGNPITKGLVFAENPAASSAQRVGSPLKTVQNSGIVYKTTGTTDYFYYASPVPITSAKELTIVSYLSTPTTTASQMAVAIGSTTSANSFFGLGTTALSTAGFWLRDSAGTDQSFGTGSYSGPVSFYAGVQSESQNRFEFWNASGIAASTAPSTKTTFSGLDRIGFGCMLRSSAGNGLLNPYIGLTAVWGRALSAAELKSLTLNPWQVFAPLQRNIYIGSASIVSIIRPAGDTTTTGWTSTGANFYDQINEVTYNDTDYITSPDLNSSPGAYTWTITPTPLAAGTWDVSVRCSDVASSGQIRIRFLDAGSSSVGVSSYQTVTGAFATQTHTVVTSASAVYGVIEVAP